MGIDLSDEAAAALRWAHDQARRWGATLEVVHAWSLPAVGDLSGIVAAGGETPFRRAADHVVAHMLSENLGDLGGVEVLTTVVEGNPAAALLDAARDADLLVVGTRGRGGFKGLLVGSVSQQCTHHARCPVVVVPPGAARGA